MPKSEAKKRADKKWDHENIATVTCRLRKDTVQKFRDTCRRADTTMNRVLTDAIKDFLEKYDTTT